MNKKLKVSLGVFAFMLAGFGFMILARAYIISNPFNLSTGVLGVEDAPVEDISNKIVYKSSTDTAVLGWFKELNSNYPPIIKDEDIILEVDTATEKIIGRLDSKNQFYQIQELPLEAMHVRLYNDYHTSYIMEDALFGDANLVFSHQGVSESFNLNIGTGLAFSTYFIDAPTKTIYLIYLDRSGVGHVYIALPGKSEFQKIITSTMLTQDSEILASDPVNLYVKTDEFCYRLDLANKQLFEEKCALVTSNAYNKNYTFINSEVESINTQDGKIKLECILPTNAQIRDVAASNNITAVLAKNELTAESSVYECAAELKQQQLPAIMFKEIFIQQKTTYLITEEASPAIIFYNEWFEPDEVEMDDPNESDDVVVPAGQADPSFTEPSPENATREVFKDWYKITTLPQGLRKIKLLNDKVRVF